MLLIMALGAIIAYGAAHEGHSKKFKDTDHYSKAAYYYNHDWLSPGFTFDQWYYPYYYGAYYYPIPTRYTAYYCYSVPDCYIPTTYNYWHYAPVAYDYGMGTTTYHYYSGGGYYFGDQ